MSQVFSCGCFALVKSNGQIIGEVKIIKLAGDGPLDALMFISSLGKLWVLALECNIEIG